MSASATKDEDSNQDKLVQQVPLLPLDDDSKDDTMEAPSTSAPKTKGKGKKKKKKKRNRPEEWARQAAEAERRKQVGKKTEFSILLV